MEPTCRQANLDDIATVSSILEEAASWLEAIGQALWRPDEISQNAVRDDVEDGLFYLFELDSEAVGTLKFQLKDELFWPDIDSSESAFVHRIAIRRAHARSGLSSIMMRWAIAEALRHQRTFLRLDCEASRPKLRAIYERFGFKHRDDRKVGPFHVSRYEISTVTTTEKDGDDQSPTRCKVDG